jgi:perosamine synthetase
MLTRRILLAGVSALVASAAKAPDKPALLGGKPIRTERGRRWPIINKKDESGWLDVLRSKQWNRRGGTAVAEFERSWADKLGAKHAIATNGGSTALLAGLYALDIGPGDEVIVPPYTFIASVNSVLLRHALPVFVDTDRATLQIDASKIEAAITSRTRAIMPVQLGGSMADMDAVMAIAKKRGLAVIEDACQSHLAEWRGRKAGAVGDIGCFSFQASKNLNAGEGGAVLTNDIDIFSRAIAQHDLWGGGVLERGGQLGRGSLSTGEGWDFTVSAGDRRITPIQAALLQVQLGRLEEQAQRRAANGSYP